MSTTYPTSKQTFTDPTNSDYLNSPDHAGLHSDINDTIEAIEDKLGITDAVIPKCGGLKPNTDGATAIKIQDSAGNNIMSFDTSNKIPILNRVGSLKIISYEGSVADNAYFDLPDAIAGAGMVMFDECADQAIFFFTDAGVVTLFYGTGNVINSQTDAYYCIYQSGTNVRIENKIGSSKNIKLIAFGG